MQFKRLYSELYSLKSLFNIIEILNLIFQWALCLAIKKYTTYYYKLNLLSHFFDDKGLYDTPYFPT